jgi:predicted ATPase/DNA-binding CsgD family transcriptional regulator
LVLPTIAQHMEIKEREELPLLDLLQLFLHDKRLLLLLDNFEQVVAAAPQIEHLLSLCPHLTILVTSRAVLHLQAEQLFPVAPLALPNLSKDLAPEGIARSPAVALFMHRTRRQLPSFQLTAANARAIAELCVRLDGLPLALELAAARVRLLPPHALLARISQRLQVLTGGPRTSPDRQQTLRKTLQWSYDLLGCEEQALFRQLAVFVGGWQLSAAEALGQEAGQGNPDVLNTLASLLDHSLIQQSNLEAGEPRFLMLQTVREYGLDLLAAMGEMQITQAAHAHVFLALAEQAELELQGPHSARWLERLEQEHDNLRGALVCLFQEAGGAEPHLKAASRERPLRLVGALWSFWYHHCHFHEGNQWLQAALSLLAEESTSPQTPAVGSGDTLPQVSNQEEVQALSTGIRTKILTGAGVFEQLYNPDSALSLHEASLRASRSAGDSLGMIAALIDLAWVALRQANYEQAERLGQQSLTLGRAFEDTHSIAASLAVLGIVALYQYQYEQARPYLEESLHLREILEERSGCAHLRTLLGHLAVLQGEYESITPLIAESMKLRQEEGNRQGIVMNLVVLTELAVAQKQPHRAARLLGARQRLFDEMELRASGAPLFIQDRVKQLQMTARAQLGEATFRKMWAEGQDMELAHVLTYALETNLEAGELMLIESVASVQAPSLFPDGLTAREREVLRLLVTGLSNAQIAEELTISLLTVKAHLRSIYSKVGVNSRVAAIRYALEHHLS